jgi:6-pyruvoyl-tetrahydropterin synthase
MKTYDLLGIHIGTSSYDIEIVSTDENIIHWISDQIQKMLPTVEIETATDRAPQIKNLSRWFKKMNYKQYSIGLFLVQKLCRDGWEPFGDISFSQLVGFSSIALRRVREESS